MTRLSIYGFLFVAAGSLGCASTVVQSTDITPQREQRKEEVIEQFEVRRNQAQYDAALQCWERGDNSGCRQNLEQLLLRAPDQHDARIMLADLLLVEGKSEQARQQLDEVLEQSPSHAPAHHAMALLHESIKSPQTALKHYERALQIDPENEIYQMSLNCCQSDASAAVATAPPNAPDSSPAPPRY